MDEELKQSTEANMPKLTKKQEIWNLIKFVLFSISAGIIQILSFTLFSELIFNDANNQYGWSYFISLALSVLWNFTFNRKFTFKSANNITVAMLLVLLYYCAFTPLSIWWGQALNNIGWNEYLVLALTMIVNFVTEFLWTRFVVYRNSINSAVDKTRKKSLQTNEDNLDDKTVDLSVKNSQNTAVDKKE